MAARLDHLILQVNDANVSAQYFERVLGVSSEGQAGPFTIVRVNENATLQLAPWGTKGGEHLAFALPRAEFDAVFARIREHGVDWGDSFHSVGNRKDPGDEVGARGIGK